MNDVLDFKNVFVVFYMCQNRAASVQLCGSADLFTLVFLALAFYRG